MHTSTVFGLRPVPRDLPHGHIFGGMLLSGKQAAEIALERIAELDI